MALDQNYWKLLTKDYLEAFTRVTGNKNPTSKQILFAATPGEFETNNGRAWEAGGKGYNIGAVQGRELTQEEMAHYLDGTLKPGAKIPGYILQEDTNPDRGGARYPMWFVSYDNRVDAIVRYLNVLLRQFAKPVFDNPKSTLRDLAQAMYLQGYYQGKHTGARYFEKRTLPLTAPEQANVDDYTKGLEGVYPRIEAGMGPFLTNETKPEVKPMPESKYACRAIVPNETEADRYCRQLEAIHQAGHTTTLLEPGTSASQSTCMVVADAAEWNARLLPEDGVKLIQERVGTKANNQPLIVDWGQYDKDMREGENYIDARITAVAATHDAWCDQNNPDYKKGPTKGDTYWMFTPGVKGTEHVSSCMNVLSDSGNQNNRKVGDVLILDTVQGGQNPPPHVQRYKDSKLVWDGKLWHSGSINGKVIKGWQARSTDKIAGEGKWPYPNSKVVIEEPTKEPTVVPPTTAAPQNDEVSTGGWTPAPPLASGEVKKSWLGWVVAPIFFAVGSLVAYLIQRC